jgi:hypothetical protein
MMTKFLHLMITLISVEILILVLAKSYIIKPEKDLAENNKESPKDEDDLW